MSKTNGDAVAAAPKKRRAPAVTKRRYAAPTKIRQTLASNADAPSATVVVDFSANKKFVDLTLEGTILGEHVQPLRDFLQNVSYSPGNQWTLRLEALDAISLRGLRVLLKFAQVIRQRGYEVHIKSIQSSVLATLLEYNWCEAFAWDKPHEALRTLPESKTKKGSQHDELRAQ